MTVDKPMLDRLIEAAEGKGWRQHGRENTSLVWRSDLRTLLLEYVNLKVQVHRLTNEAKTT